MQLRTNRRGRSPAPSSVNPVKLRTNHRPHAPAPSSMNHVKLRTKRRLSCLSPWSSGNPVHLRITRVGQATCHQCEQIRRVVTASGLVGPFERRDETIVPANIEQTKKGCYSKLSQLDRHALPPRLTHITLSPVCTHTPPLWARTATAPMPICRACTCRRVLVSWMGLALASGRICCCTQVHLRGCGPM